MSSEAVENSPGVVQAPKAAPPWRAPLLDFERYGLVYVWLALVQGGRVLQTHALEDWMERGYAALQVMENHLKTHAYFATGELTFEDIALYGYTHLADR